MGGRAVSVELLGWLLGAASVVAAAPLTPTYETDIRPILERCCYDCHGGNALEAELDLRTVSGMLRGGVNGAAVTRGDSKASLLIDMVKEGQMPPEGGPLTVDEVTLLECWIAAGAPSEEAVVDPAPRSFLSDADRQFWAFRPPHKRDIPVIAHKDRVRTPIDAFLLAKLEARGLCFSSDADKSTLVRRAYFDLLGLPPTPEELEAFLSDSRPDAYERLIDHLLESPHYGERWARHWLDVTGYVDSDDLITEAKEFRQSHWRYRDYVVRAFNQDKSIDRFFTEQLAGDEMVSWRAEPRFNDEIRELLIATGYLRNINDWTDAPEYGIDQRYAVLFEVMQVASSSLLGLTMDCCRCHNHKYDPISQRDYYRMMAVFETAFNVHEWKPPKVRLLADVSPVEKAEIDEHNAPLDEQLKVLQSEIDALHAACRDRLIEERLSAVPESIRADVRHAIKIAADQRTVEQQRLFEKHQAVSSISPEELEVGLSDDERSAVTRVKEKQGKLETQRRSYGQIAATWDMEGAPPQSRLLRRGDCFSPGVPVTPGFVEVLCQNSSATTLAPPDNVPGGSSGRRLAFAHWLTSSDNPLTARVFVNRVWHHHFGRGIVRTLANFGRSGSPPTHPELLDWLAVDFRENGWRLKRLHKLIMTSTAYRQASRAHPNETLPAAEIDPTNELFWRMNLRRREAEALRDALLVASDRLDRTVGGPPVMFATPADGLSQVDSPRRSLYLLARRNYPLKFMDVFDAPIIAVNCPQRAMSATVLQTLTFLNGDFVVDQAKQVARRALGNQRSNDQETIHRAYGLVFSRPPSEGEASRSLQFVRDLIKEYERSGLATEESTNFAWSELCHMLLCSNEFLYIE